MSNRISELFAQTPESEGLLNVYFTAGYPQINDTRRILAALQSAGADFVEIGMPYSDPVADGETIQESNQVALDNGMTVKLLLQQLHNMRDEIHIPVLLMGYINPILQYGIERFCQEAAAAGVDGLILPDLPLEAYVASYKDLFERNGLVNIFLITPQTRPDRILELDKAGSGFVYMVSSASVTGAKTGVSEGMEAYFERIHRMNLRNPRMIGFGIKDRESFQKASRYSRGAIIGSAFIRMLQESRNLEEDIASFISGIKPNKTQVEHA